MATLLLVAVSVFVLSAIVAAHVKAPWSDEGWFACPAYNLAFHGFMGTSVLEPSGHFLNAYLRGIQQRTYVVPPLYIVLLAGWFRVFGFGLLTMRALSTLWGVVAMLALFLLIRKLINGTVALLAAGILACDFTFVWASAEGRMDAMCTALSLTALALYVNLRESRFLWAFIGANVCIAAAFLTHPNAMMAFAGLVYLAWHYDRKRIRFSHLLIGATPYVVALAAWSFYILQDPADFRVQFLANAAGRGSVRLEGLLQPWNAVWKEVLLRYGVFYSFDHVWWVPGSRSTWMVAILVMYFGAALFLWSRREVRANDGQKVLLVLLGIWFLVMTFFVGFKTPMYLVYVIPLWDAVLALCVWKCWSSGRVARGLGAAALAVFVVLNWQALMTKRSENSYTSEYQPSVAFLRPYTDQGARVYAIAALGFDIDYRRFTDDGRLGFYTHKLADVILIDHSYHWWRGWFKSQEHPVFEYVESLLASKYHVANKSGTFLVYVRNGYELPPVRR
jgi:4-amino-4-deoxy-L-arabinose transferase-like glycosyltransferase